MSKSKSENSVLLEALINIFTVEKGKLKILLVRKKDEPYKGYWTLPNKIITNEETIEDGINLILQEQIGLNEIYHEQDYTFSSINRNPNERIIGTSYIGLTDSKTIEIKREKKDEIETKWFLINEIPKMAYDHKEIIEKSIEKLKTKLVNSNVLKSLFPSDFTLPELQNIYESILNTTLDRRNFRKKFISLGLIEDTGYKNEGGNGRPAKLYKFKENIKEINLF